MTEQPVRHAPEVTESHTRLRQRLVTAIRAVCPPWMIDRQDDLVQVAMIAVLKQQEKQGEKRDFPNAYLRRVAYTALVDEIRRLHTDKEVALEDAAPPSAPKHEDPERRALSREISTAVRACLERLAPPRRLAVTFHLLSYKVPQIATRMDWTRKRAENLVYRGLDNLRRCLELKGLTP